MSFYRIKNALFLCAGLVAFTANGATVGRTESTGSTSQLTLRSAQRIIMPTAGTITSVSFYHGATGAQVVVGIYNDNAGSPGTLIERSGIMGVESAGWQTITLPNSVNASANQTLWLAWMFYLGPTTVYTTNTANGFRYVSGSTWTSDPNTIMPISFGTASTILQSREYSVYATYTPTSGGLPPSQFWSPYTNGIYTTSNVGIFPIGSDGIEFTGDNGFINRIRAIQSAQSMLAIEASNGVTISSNSQDIEVGGAYDRIRLSAPVKIGGLDGDPVSELEVAGVITANALKINNWTIEAPDYVFEHNYNLRSLDEVEQMIKSDKHLPEIPSAVEMKEKGVDLSEMNMLLLKKVEELTLYMIEQNKKINALEKNTRSK